MRSFQLIKVNKATPYERGIQYGEQAKEKIQAGIEDYMEFFAQTDNMSWAEIRESAISYIPLIKKVMPEIFLEAKGIAVGAGVDLDDIMVLNCRYEITKFNSNNECTTCVVLLKPLMVGKHCWSKLGLSCRHSG